MATNTLGIWLAASLAVAALAGCTSDCPPPGAALPQGTVSEGLVSATARVKEIDQRRAR